MTSAENRLAAVLLRMAAETYSNHGCNDFDLAQVIPDADERNELVRRFHEYNGDAEEYEADDRTPDYRLQDWALMDLMAHRLDGQ